MNLNRPTFIVFEGLDGSGKSTCAAELAKRTGATLLTTPSPDVRLYRDALVSSLGSSQEARQLFYLATVFTASEAVTSLLREGRSVVLDRYFLSTQAYAAFRGTRLRVDELERLLLPADLTAYIDTPLATRIARLNARGATAADRETVTIMSDARLRDEHRRRSHLGVLGRYVVVDGDRNTPSQVSDLIVAELREIVRNTGREGDGDPYESDRLR